MIDFTDLIEKRERIAVVGLGYVGLPLAVTLAKHFSVIGFDISERRVAGLKKGRDFTGEVRESELASPLDITFTSREEDLVQARLFIVAVPTPINKHRDPDLTPVEKASATVGSHMPTGSLVVYESTVYPGVTEEICVPILAEWSGYTYGRDFMVGYSPERINPGDKVHTVEHIKKVVSASDAHSLELLAKVYGAVIDAGVHKAPSIKVAEAAKVIENTQRDLNIALMNELSMIFDRLGIDTLDVLTAASTKWNFLPFRPGLVGGHCIGVDPYYLTYKAEEVGYNPEMILAGRRINDGMGKYVAERAVKMLIAAGKRVDKATVGIFGLTFKENVPDLRNTRVVDIKAELEEYGVRALVHDPLANSEESRREYGFALTELDEMRDLQAIILAVPHAMYTEWSLDDLTPRFADGDKPILLDIKGLWDRGQAEARHFAYWRL